MANAPGPIIPTGGLPSLGKRVMWTPKEIEDYGDGRAGTGYVGEVAYKAWDGLRELFGGKKKAKEGKISQPPAPEGGYSTGRSYASKDLDYAQGYAKIVRMAKRLGYNVVELPENVMLGRFGNGEGYERGRNIYHASNLTDETKTEVTVHELLAKLMRDGTDRSHESLHPFIEPVQRPIADALAA